MILPLINFRSWAQIEFVIKEAVREPQINQFGSKFTLGWKWSDQNVSHTAWKENLYLKHVGIAILVSFNTSFSKYFKMIEAWKSVWD